MSEVSAKTQSSVISDSYTPVQTDTPQPETAPVQNCESCNQSYMSNPDPDGLSELCFDQQNFKCPPTTYDLSDPRAAGSSIVQPVLVSAAGDVASIVEEIPAAVLPGPEIEAQWNAKVSEFETSIKENDIVKQQKIFAELIDLAIRKSGFEGIVTALNESKKLEDLLQDKFAKIYNTHETTVHSAFACHAKASDRDGAYAKASKSALDEEAIYADGIAKQRAVVDVRLAQKKAALDAIENDLLDVLSKIQADPSVAELPLEMQLSPSAATVFAEMFASLGDFERASKYYNISALSPVQTTAGSVWARLKAIGMDMQNGDQQQIADFISEVKKIREALPQFLARSKEQENAALAGLGENGEINSAQMDFIDPGSSMLVHKLNALSWGLLYDAYMLLEGDYEPEILDLEKIRREMVLDRKNSADEIEAGLHLRNFQRVATLKTLHGGTIERKLREDGKVEAQKEYSKLVDDFYEVTELAGPHVLHKAGNQLFEGLAALGWQVFFDGMKSRDLPRDGLVELSTKVLVPFTEGGYAESNYVRYQLTRLKEDAPWLFAEDGSFNPNVDMSGRPEGKDAAARTISSYYSGNSTLQELGLPTGAAVGCFLIGGLFAETLVVPMMMAGACSVGGSFASRGINTMSAGEQYKQALSTGLSQISHDEERANRNIWAINAGLGAVFNGTLAAPGVAIWGGIGTKAVTTAAKSVGAKAAAEESLGKAIGAGLKTVGHGVAETGKTVGTTFWKMSPLAKLHVGLGTGAMATDYLFLDSFPTSKEDIFDVNFVSPFADGTSTKKSGYKIDTAVGYAGWTALYGGLGYGLLQATWRKRFTELMAKSVLRRGVVQVGADLLMADYFLFSQAKDGTLHPLVFGKDFRRGIEKADEYRYERQFTLDSYVAPIGALMMFGSWGANELTMSTRKTQYQTAAWFAMIGADIAFIDKNRNLTLTNATNRTKEFKDNFDGHFDTWIGGVGGAFLIAQMGDKLVNVNAAGSMVGVVFRITYEWLMQAQQAVPLKAPDPIRMMSAAGESVAMIVFVQGTYLGAHNANTYPLGRNIGGFIQGIPGVRSIPSAQNMGSIEFLGGNDPSIVSWKNGSKLTPFNNGHFKKGSGKIFREYELRSDKHWNMGVQSKDGEPFVLTVSKRSANEPVKFLINGEPTFAGAAIDENLLRYHGYLWHNEELYQFAPIRQANVRINPGRMTVQDVKNLTSHARERVETAMKQDGWEISTRYDNNGVQLFRRRWTENPYHPVVKLEKPPEGTAFSTDEWKIVPVKIEKYPDRGFIKTLIMGKGDPEVMPVWLSFDRSVKYADSIPIEGGHFEGPIWSKTREAPKWSIRGAGLTALPIGAMAYGVNKVIFQRTSSGDPDYQPLQRGANYLFTALFTWPFIQAPLGMDSFEGQMAGRLIGFFPNLMGNKFFPTYRDTVPGMEGFLYLLDGNWHEHTCTGYWNEGKYGQAIADGAEKILYVGGIDTDRDLTANYKTMTTSWKILPSDTVETIEMFEWPAISTVSGAFDCRFDILNGMKPRDSMSCSMLRGKVYDNVKSENEAKKINFETMRSRFEKWASEFEKKVAANRDEALDEIELRTLVMMAAQIKHFLYKYMVLPQTMIEYNSASINAKERDLRYALEPLYKLAFSEGSESKFIFDGVRVLGDEEKEWTDFIFALNHSNLKTDVLERLRNRNDPVQH